MTDQGAFHDDLYKFLVVTLERNFAHVSDKKFKAIFITIKDS